MFGERPNTVAGLEARAEIHGPPRLTCSRVESGKPVQSSLLGSMVRIEMENAVNRLLSCNPE
jgi:hypothetical protein